MSQEPSPPPATRRKLGGGWRVAALVVLFLAVAAVVVASRASFAWGHRPFPPTPLTEQQQESIIAAARASLGPKLAALGNLTTEAGKYGIVMNTSGGPKTAAPVFFKGENVTLVALVDVATGEVVETTETHSMGWMAELQGQKRETFRWGPPPHGSPFMKGPFRGGPPNG